MKIRAVLFIYFSLLASSFTNIHSQEEAIKIDPIPCFLQNAETNEVTDEIIAKTFYATPSIIDHLHAALVKTVTIKHQNGAAITLGDGSSWHIAFALGRHEVNKKWALGDEVVLRFDQQSFYPVLHNLTKKLSVYVLSIYPPKPTSSEAVIITAITQNALITNKGTCIYFTETPKSYPEICIGDVISLFIPIGNEINGSIINVWCPRLIDIYTNCLHTSL